MDEEKSTSKGGRIRLEPRIRGEKYKRIDQEKEINDYEIKTINVERIIKKNALRLAITIMVFAVVFAVKSLPFSTAQKISQGIKWAVTYQMDWNEDVVDRRNIIPAISNQIDKFIGTGDMIGDSEKNNQYISPVSGVVTSPFQDTIHPVFNTKIEARGIEISGQSSREIKTIDKGKVVHIQDSIYGGNKITIEHNDSTRSVYEGCYESTHKVNDVVDQGEVLGSTESVEEGEKSVFYFELWKGNHAVNPLDYISLEVDTAN